MEEVKERLALHQLRHAHKESARNMSRDLLEEAHRMIEDGWEPSCTDDYEYQVAVIREYERRGY